MSSANGDKITDLPVVADCKFADIFPAVQDGVTCQFTQQKLFDLFFSNTFINQNSRYVDGGGSDITGNGSVINPYQTISFALSQITTASPSNPFGIIVQPGIYAENIGIKPSVSISGNAIGGVTKINGNVTLDPSYTVNGDTLFSNIEIQQNVNIDFSAMGVASSTIGFNNCVVDGALDFIGASGQNNQLVSLTGIFNGNIHVSSAFNVSTGNIYTGNYLLDSAVSNGDSNNISNADIYFGSVTYQNTGANNTTARLMNSSVFGAMTIDGANTNLGVDVDSFKILTILNGANYSLLNIGDGLDSNFSPSFYTPVDASVTGNLKGIDNQFNLNFHYKDATNALELMVGNTGYTVTHVGGVLFTLPITSSVGQALEVVGYDAGGWGVAQGAGQQIIVSGVPSTLGAGGSIASTGQYDSIRLVCVVADTIWNTCGKPDGTIAII